MTAKNKELIKNWIEKKLQGQGNPIDDLDSTVVFVIPGASGNPIFGKFVGIEEVKIFFQLLQEKLSQAAIKQSFLVKNCIAEGNQVVVLLDEVFRYEQQPSNQFVNETAWFFKLNDEQKIVHLHCYDNTLVTSKVLA